MTTAADVVGGFDFEGFSDEVFNTEDIEDNCRSPKDSASSVATTTPPTTKRTTTITHDEGEEANGLKKGKVRSTADFKISPLRSPPLASPFDDDDGGDDDDIMFEVDICDNSIL